MPDYIDACIFLAVAQDERRVQQCRSYLNVAGYKNHPKGVISQTMLGEMVFSLLAKLSPDSAERSTTAAIRFIAHMIADEKALLLRSEPSPCVADDLCKADYALTRDDALNLSCAIALRCNRFTTIDTHLLRCLALQMYLRTEYGLTINEP